MIKKLNGVLVLLKFFTVAWVWRPKTTALLGLSCQHRYFFETTNHSSLMIEYCVKNEALHSAGQSKVVYIEAKKPLKTMRFEGLFVVPRGIEPRS